MYPDKPTVRARDLMKTGVITLAPHTTVLDVHRVFIAEGLHGAPVLDAEGAVCGVVSAIDLVRLIRGEPQAARGAAWTTYFRDEQPYVGAEWMDLPGPRAARMQQLTVGDAMTRDVVMVEVDAPVDEIARTMLQHHVHRLLVGERRVLRGVITTFELLRVLSRVGIPVPGGPGQTGDRRGEPQ